MVPSSPSVCPSSKKNEFEEQLKKLTWILFLSYFGVFVLLGLIFYYKYLNSYLSAGANPPSAEVQNPSSIYFSARGNLYRINPEYLKAGAVINSSEQIQSSGEVFSLDQTTDGKKIAYSIKNSAGNFEVWELELSSNSSEIISDKVKTEGFSDFMAPVFAPRSSKLAILGKSAETFAIFVLSADGVVTKLTTENTRINAFDWNKDGSKLVYCTADQICHLISASSGKIEQSFTANVSQIFWKNREKLFFLGQTDGVANIYSLKVGEAEPIKITNVGSPKTIDHFEIDDRGENLSYQVSERGATDVYVAQSSGSNPIQLSNDQKSFSPVISPAGEQIAYITVGDGIYAVASDGTSERKILNFPEKIDRLLAWR